MKTSSPEPEVSHPGHASTVCADAEPKNDKVELSVKDCYNELGFGFSTLKKWYIITIVFWIQLSMNFNATVYNNAVPGTAEEFGVSHQAAKCGSAVFFITYAFGCQLWAPLSEEYGRSAILRLSMVLVSIFQLIVATASNFTSVIVGRAFLGLSAAAGSVTLGMIADLWEPDNHQYAVAYVVFSSVGGSILGPIVGGFLEQYTTNWRWCIFTQQLLGTIVQVAHSLTVPETRPIIMMDQIARRRREDCGENVWGPHEIRSSRDGFSFKKLLTACLRPFRMFFTEPIVFFFSLVSGFADALIFMLIHSSVYGKVWDLKPGQAGLTLVPILLSYFVSWLALIPIFRSFAWKRRERPEDEHTQFESRLWPIPWILFLPLVLGCFTASVHPTFHWAVPMTFAAVLGIFNYAIYMTTVDYMISIYGPYSASAMGGNGWARYFLAGMFVLASDFVTENMLPAAVVLNILAWVVGIMGFVLGVLFVRNGDGSAMRKHSPFVQKLV